MFLVKLIDTLVEGSDPIYVTLQHGENGGELKPEDATAFANACDAQVWINRHDNPEGGWRAILVDRDVEIKVQEDRRATSSVLLAADCIAELRKCDVFRVMSDGVNQGTVNQIANYIKRNRPDLSTEVDACLEELAGV